MQVSHFESKFIRSLFYLLNLFCDKAAARLSKKKKKTFDLHCTYAKVLIINKM